MCASKVKKVAVIGAGVEGHAIAVVFANAGYSVALNDVRQELLDRAMENIERKLANIYVANNLLSEEEARNSLSRIKPVLNLAETVKDADFIEEAVPEKLDLKRQVFMQIEKITSSNAIIATNTSGLKVTDIASVIKKADRVVGCHFSNPADLDPMVEVIRGEKTSDETVEMTKDLMLSCGKRPVILHKEVLAFALNRLTYALWREALNMIANGVLGAEDVDFLVTASLCPRFATSGLMKGMDWYGVDKILSVVEYLLPDMDNYGDRPIRFLKGMVARGLRGTESKQGFYKWTDKEVEEITRQMNETMVEIYRKRMKSKRQ